MANVHFQLVDVDQQVFDSETIITPASLGLQSNPQSDWSIRMNRLHGGLSEGVDVISLHSGGLQLEVLPTRGMGIWKGSANGVPLGWNSPVQRPVHPNWVDQMRRGGIGWLDGFNELICRCGLGWHGAPGNDVICDSDGKILSEQFLPLHGRIANLPAHKVSVSASDDGPGRIDITGEIDEASMFGGHLRLRSTLSVVPGACEFRITDVVTNMGSNPAEVEMLYHCNIGEPFLGEGSEYHGAATEVAPRDPRAADGINMWNIFQGPTPGYSEQVYFTKPVADADGFGMAVLTNAEATAAFCVRFDTSTLPWFVLWKNTQPTADGYVTGLEPGSSFPNLRSVERKNGRVIRLESQEEVGFDLKFQIATNRQQARKLLDEVTSLQVASPRTIHSKPLPGWSS